MPSFSTEKAFREYLASPDAILNRYLAAMFLPGDVEAAEKFLVTRDQAFENPLRSNEAAKAETAAPASAGSASLTPMVN